AELCISDSLKATPHKDRAARFAARLPANFRLNEVQHGHILRKISSQAPASFVDFAQSAEKFAGASDDGTSTRGRQSLCGIALNQIYCIKFPALCQGHLTGFS
ncbi:MAG: hypothetical protein K2J77_12740, partial [Oscillospiraceae bacterium]|nr:hypothetical protein [Oscillospiraceae bacterium]